jgi:hypothetical protein
MSKLICSPKGRLALLTLIFCGVALSVLFYRDAQAAPYVNPFWTNASPSQESAIDMVADRAIICESGDATAAGGRLSIDLRTGEVFYDLFLFDTPGVVEDNVFALRWRSMISGSSQLGNGGPAELGDDRRVRGPRRGQPERERRAQGRRPVAVSAPPFRFSYGMARPERHDRHRRLPADDTAADPPRAPVVVRDASLRSRLSGWRSFKHAPATLSQPLRESPLTARRPRL